MKRFLLFFILFSLKIEMIQASQSAIGSVDPVTLKAIVPTTAQQIPDYRVAHLQQINYFFDHLPQAPLPSKLTAQIERLYGPLLPILSPLVSSQTQPERQQEVMGHIQKFYGLLYLIAQAEMFQKEAVTTGSGATTALAGGNAISNSESTSQQELTVQQLLYSGIWQDHLKIMIASSFAQELNLLNSVHEHELKMFDYLPAFEMAYYQPTVTHLRNASELTRMYLLLVNRMRKRFLQKIDPATDWGKLVGEITSLEEQIKTATPSDKLSLYESLKTSRSNLYDQIAAFEQSPFYSVVMQFQTIDWSKRYPVAFSDADGNSLSLMQVIKKKYDFTQYFSFDAQTNTVVVSPAFSLCLVVQNDTAGNPELYLTGLGNWFFTGDATTRTITTAAGDAVIVGTLNVTKKSSEDQVTFDQFFVEKKVTETVKGVSVTHTVTETTLGFYELLCFMAMKSLQADVADLFMGQNLSLTLSALAKQPFTLPNFMEKWPEDYPILHDIAFVQDSFKLQSGSSQPAVTPQSFFSSIGDAFSTITHPFVSLADEIKQEATNFYDALPGPVQRALQGIKDAVKTGFTKAAEESWDAIKDVGDATWHGLKAAGYEAVTLYYASCILPLATYGLSGGKAGAGSVSAALKDSQEWQAATTQQINDATNDLGQAVADVSAAVESVETVASGIVCSVVSMADSKLGQDFSGIMNSVTDVVVNYFKDYADAIILVGSDVVKLTAQSADLITTVVGDVLSGGLFTKDGIDAIGDDVKNIAETTASSFLGFVTFGINAIGQELQSVMLTIAYLTAAATQLVIDVTNVIAATVVGAFTGQWNYNEYRTALESQSRLISGLVTLTAIVVVTVATGGAALPFAVAMLALTAPMMVMSLIGDVQQDSIAINKKAHEKQFTQDYKEYVISSAKVLEGFNIATVIENLVQLQAENFNNERGLLYSQSYLNTLFVQNLSQSMFGYGMSMFKNFGQNSATGVMKADLGSLYGISTGRFNSDPAGNGFAVYNDARQTFSQEVATEPLQLATSKSILSNAPEPETFWFRQKDLSNIANNRPLRADILWKSLYEYNGPFYIGIYLTERYCDIQAVQNVYNNFITVINPSSGNTADTDFENSWSQVSALNRYLVDYDHLAKMFVCYRDQTDVPQLGLYVHEAPTTLKTTDGWVQNNFKSITFERGVWYRMQATLEGSTLTTRFWTVGTDQDAKNATLDDSVPSNALVQTFTNMPVAQIPTEVAQFDTSNKYAGSMGVIASGASIEYVVLSPQTTISISEQRAQSNQSVPQNTVMQQNQQWYQNLAQEMNPTFGQFKLSPTSETAILQQQYIYSTKGTFNALANDYVVFVASLTPTGSQVGVSPAATPPPVGIMSLATGEIYNSAGQMIGQVANPVFLYQQVHGKIAQEITNQLAQVRKEYWQSMTGPFNFSGTALTGLLPAMSQGVFIYSMSPQQNGYTDYVMCATQNSTGITTTNIPFMKQNGMATINALVSLVSGAIYTVSADNTITITTNNYNNLYNQYQKQVPQSIQNQIAASQKIYQTQIANMAADQALQQQGQTAVNNLNSAISSGQGELSFATGTYLTALTTAQTAAQSALTTVQTDLTNLTTAMTQATVPTTATVYTALQASITAANNAATALNNAVTAANNAPATTTTNYGSAAGSAYGATSSYGNFNSTYGSYGGYGSSYGNSYGGYGGYG